MELERRPSVPARRPSSFPARIAIGGLAAFGLIVLLQWVLAALFGVIRLALFVVIVVAAGAWVMQSKASR